MIMLRFFKIKRRKNGCHGQFNWTKRQESKIWK